MYPITGIARTRILERRSRQRTIRKHEVGARMSLWELLPSTRDAPTLQRTAQLDAASRKRLPRYRKAIAPSLPDPARRHVPLTRWRRFL